MSHFTASTASLSSTLPPRHQQTSSTVQTASIEKLISSGTIGLRRILTKHTSFILYAWAKRSEDTRRLKATRIKKYSWRSKLNLGLDSTSKVAYMIISRFCRSLDSADGHVFHEEGLSTLGPRLFHFQCSCDGRGHVLGTEGILG